jgi:class 3 adenylate cyclase/tetratricopeptide (TPR) repeat protein
VVTALFCDVTGSTALGEQLDPEVLRAVLNRYFEVMRAVIERHGGTVEKFIGDAVMAVFGIPRVHEDDALRAVRAAAEIRERLPELAEQVGVELQFRTGVNTGPVLIGEGENLAVGDAVNVAARLEQAAEPGEIVIGLETLRLVRDAVEVEPLEPLELKGKSERVPAYRLIGVDPAAEGFARHLNVALVGRQRELRLLTHAWDRTVEESGCHLFTLLGVAGVGKSRLVGELLARVGEEALVLRGRCLPYGEGITFWPLEEALMPVGEPAQHVLGRLGAGGAATPEELFWEVRLLLESLAAQRPVILSIEDLHWAEPMLLDLLDHVADLSRGASILLLCTARPELLEDRHGWGGGKLNATTVLLESLAVADAEALLDELGDGLDPAARARVIEASEGNPLFLEEMVALARERGTVDVPPTIQALLAARLERLGVGERELLERGAVEGEVFHRLAVRALVDERGAAEIELRLSGLVRKELIRPHPATISGDAFRFRHLLIRDAAYDGLPKAVRAELHERFARWLQDAGAGLAEVDEIAGWHLEQAVRYRRELGQEVDVDLIGGAASRLHAAGRRAAARTDAAAASSLLARALALAPHDDPLRPWVAVELAEQLMDVGELGRAEAVLAESLSDPATADTAELARLELLHRFRPHEAAAAMESSLPGLFERFAAAGDERGLARAHKAAFWLYWNNADATAALRELRVAAEHAGKAGDEGLRALVIGASVAPLVYGPTDVRQMTAELDAMEHAEQGPFVRGVVELGRSVVARLEGRFAEARERGTRARETFASLGHPREGMALQELAEIHRCEGDLAGALTMFEEYDAVNERLHEHGFRSTSQAMIAEVKAQFGDCAGARAACDLAMELSAPEDMINYAITHRVRSLLARQEADLDEAERWARSAVEHAGATDFYRYHVRTRLELARVLSARGRRDDATSEARAAVEVANAKGDRPEGALAQAFLDELEPLLPVQEQ